MIRLKFLSFIFALKLLQNCYAQPSGYWQQNVDYLINVSLDDIKHEISGDITITYKNNSPSEISFIYMHLWPNAYRNNSTAFAKQEVRNGHVKFQFAKDEVRGYMDNLDFKVDGSEAKLEYDNENIDIAKLILNRPLKSGEQVTITTPFHVKIPSSRFSRLGHSGQSYQITQWYPKPAVYDQYGWHPIPYLNQGEFYSEFGNFDVHITVPANYIVAASGDLQTQSEIDFLNQKAGETLKINISDKDLSYPESSAETKTLNYKIENAHDFAWFADKRFHVLKSQITLPYSQRIVTSWTYFTNLQADLWMKSTDYVNRAVSSYSGWIGEYPWNVAQAVEGALSAGAGMEYPTITIIGESTNAQQLDEVITHEVGHNWFYGILGSNEREHAWMDEGINSYYEHRYMHTYYESNAAGVTFGLPAGLSAKSDVLNKDLIDAAFIIDAAFEKTNKAQPVDMHADKYSELNYGLVVYEKTSFLFRYLAEFLGQGQFDRIMGVYYTQWQFKHPYPEDVRKIFEQESGEGMGWFFDKLLKDDRSLDYNIGEVLTGVNTVSARVKNNTDIPAPFPISLMIGDSVIKTDWQRGFIGTQTIFLNKGSKQKITHVKIDAQQIMPEYQRENNLSKTKGLFRHIEPLQIKPLFGFDNPNKTTIYYSPILGANYHNGFMLGLGCWNSTFPAPKFEYVFAPMYAFKSQNFAGQGSVGFNFYPEKGFISRWRIGEFASHYNYLDFDSATFTKYETKLEAELWPKHLNKKITQTISFRNVIVQEQGFSYYSFENLIHVEDQQNEYNELKYEVRNNKKLRPYSFRATIQQHEDFLKPFAEFNYRINYPKAVSGVDIRLFAGAIDSIDDHVIDPRYYYSVSGDNDNYDYLYDEIFFNRNNEQYAEDINGQGILARQMTMHDGFLKIPYASQHRSDSYLLASNLEFAIPFKGIPIALFADFVYNPAENIADNTLHYDAGFMLRLPNNIFEIYFPLIASNQYADPLDDFGKNISFLLNLNALNPFEKLRKVGF